MQEWARKPPVFGDSESSGPLHRPLAGVKGSRENLTPPEGFGIMKRSCTDMPLAEREENMAHQRVFYAVCLIAGLTISGCAFQVTPPPVGAMQAPREGIEVLKASGRVSRVRIARVLAVNGQMVTVDVGGSENLRPRSRGLVEAAGETTLGETGKVAATGRIIAEVLVIEVGAGESITRVIRKPGAGHAVRVGDRVHFR